MPAQKKTLKINLLPREDFDLTFAGQFLKWALTYGRYIIIITQIVVLSVFFMRFKLDRDHVDLKEAIDNKATLLQSVSDVEAQIRKIQDRLAQIKTIESDEYIPLNVLKFLEAVTPVDIVYKNIAMSTGGLSLNGSGTSLQSLSGLLLQLKRSGKFTEITLDSVKRNSDGSVIFNINNKFLTDSFKI